MKDVRFGSYFQALDRRAHVELAALEVDQAVTALVAAALPERGQTTVVVAAAALLQALRSVP
jgi:hypothetical protein